MTKYNNDSFIIIPGRPHAAALQLLLQSAGVGAAVALLPITLRMRRPLPRPPLPGQVIIVT